MTIPHQITALTRAFNTRMGLVFLTFAALWPSEAHAGNWTSTGPNSPGMITSVTVDGSGTVYTGASIGETAGGGVFRSYDRGGSWNPPSLTGQNVTAIAAGPPGVVYAGAYTGSVFKSVSGGADWTQIVAPDPSNWVMLLRIDPVLPNIVYRATKARLSPGGAVFGELFRSADGGTTWTRLMTGLFVRAFAIDPRNSSILYVFSSGFLKSSDSGATWTRLPNALDMQAPNSLVVDPISQNSLYAGTFSGVFKSTDGGITFHPSGGGFGFAPVDHTVISRTQGHAIYAGTRGDGVFTSTNGGTSWVQINDGLGGQVISDLATDRPGSFVYAATANGVYSYQTSVDVTTLSLNASHIFRVTVNARDQRTGRSALGLAIPQNDLFGYFSLPELTGDPSNPEIFVKIIDGRAVNGKYWVFYAGLTDVEYTLTVLEEATGQIRTYEKQAGSACGGFDTTAF